MGHVFQQTALTSLTDLAQLLTTLMLLNQAVVITRLLAVAQDLLETVQQETATQDHQALAVQAPAQERGLEVLLDLDLLAQDLVARRADLALAMEQKVRGMATGQTRGRVATEAAAMEVA